MSYLENYAIYQEKHLGSLNDVWVRLEYDRLQSLKKTDIVVDAGAAIGEFTVKASMQSLFVYAFEPEPENFAMLQKNTAKFANVRIFNNALSSSSGKQPLYLSQNWGGHSLVSKADNRTVEVETITLDEVVDEADFLKVDVEASELEVFKGATKLLQNCHPFIAVEIHNKEIFQNVADFLAQFNYACHYGIIDSHIIEVKTPTYGTVYFSSRA